MNIINNDTLDNLLSGFKDCFFVNIGANDGIENDPLYKFVKNNNWKGIYVEPGIESFTSLKNNFSDTENFIFENIAISNFDGEIDLFYGTTQQHFSVSESYANWMYDVVPNKRSVPCLTPTSLLRKHNVSNVDIVSIDTEGHDAVILCNFPFDVIKPKVVIVEFIYVQIAGSSMKDMQNYLTMHGYRCFFNEGKTDIIGIREDVEIAEISNVDDNEIYLEKNINKNSPIKDVSIKTNNNITKQINLQEHDGLSVYKNYACQQHHDTFNVFYGFLNQIKPSNIIEIGTALGGFTCVINEFIKELNLNCSLLSYEIHDQPWYDDMRGNGIDVRIENVFTSKYTDTTQYVKDYIQQEGITIVLCDGGSKKDEFNVLSDYLKIGDFILAHDYGYNFEIFEKDIKNKIWNWCEITESDIQISCKRNNLIDYDRKVFNDIAWVCKIKAY